MKILDFLEKSIAVVCIIAFGGSVLPLMLTGGDPQSGDLESSAVTVLYGGIYVLLLVAIALRPAIAFQIPFASPALTMMLAFAFLTALWSLFPDVTLRRSIAFLFTTVFGIWLGLRFRFPEIMRLMVIGLSFLMFASFFMIFAMPQIGLDSAQHIGAWKGVFFQKNVTGRMMVWLVLCLVWLDWQKEASRWITRGLLALAMLLIIMSRSGTGLVTSVLVSMALLSTTFMRGSIRSFAPTMALLIALLVIVVTAGATFWYDVLYALGRDPTLTGRTVLWEHIVRSVWDRPLLGYGYAAYWFGINGPAASFTRDWGITSAHSGWLELTLDLGLVGVVLVVALLSRLLFQGFFAARYGSSRAEAAWSFAVGCALLAVSVSESVFAERHSLNWVIATVAVVRLVQQSRWQRMLHDRAEEQARLHRQGRPAPSAAFAASIVDQGRPLYGRSL
ncbi:O-antigen ligase family protein [Azospirillum picis]|uniref:O-antigen ligase n=1 Tax=Azospirillum picis TaxID=488438 RepID=A0ABU0MHD9_9PROT|nr:O-antigen ligase family protein [Azospirillum picis]MBP2299109.1 O-antigen ligase [Azospirillum picis]MDQ0532649.1 O-antigen ligase [Azospirillum picis]